MVQINSDDYHDYVFKDGVFIGKFEEMYKKSKDIPWHQDKQDDWLDIKITVELLKEYGPFDYICDFGCGLGYFLDILYKKIGKKEAKIIGYDISKTCCEKARKLFPNFNFNQLDLMGENKYTLNKELNNKAEKRLFVLRGTLWYIFLNMHNVVKNIANIVTGESLLFICQNFPPLESQFVGKEVIPNPEAIITWFSPYFSPMKTIWLKDYQNDGNVNWFLGIFSRKTA
jgi:SAM-dependent methyltransferase